MGLKTAWSTFFEGNPTESDGKSLSEDNQYYVHDTQFIKLDARAVYLSSSSDSTKLLLEDIFFNNIISNNAGNCLYFYDKGECVQSRICTVNNTATYEHSNGHHSFVEVTNSNSQVYKNYFIDSTISCCGKEGIGDGNLYHWYGEILFNKINVSNCFCRYYCCLYNSGGNTESISNFSTFFENTASANFAIAMYSTSNKLSFVNIINDKAQNHLINQNGNPLTIENSILEGNTANPIFAFPQQTTLINCICANENDDFNNVNTNNMKTSRFILILHHLETNLCEANYIVNFPLCDDKTLLLKPQVNSCRRLSSLSPQGIFPSKIIYFSFHD